MNKRAAIIGGGVIGGGWAARFLLHGWDVSIFDPDPQTERKVGEVITNARTSLPQLLSGCLPPEGSLSFYSTIADAVADTQWIQESVPERIEIKHTTYSQIMADAPDGTPIGSSTSGYMPSQLQENTSRPQHLVVAHPFNPVYLLPLVELVPTKQNTPEFIQHCKQILTDIGMVALHVRKEIDAHIADRLLETVWREALWMVKDDIATTEEIDDAIRNGFGLRWAQMGLFETYRIAGGEAGMEHFIAQFGPCLQWPWSRLTDVPELTDELTRKIASQSDSQSGHLSIRELEQLRDDNLVGLLRALKDRNAGAGAHLNQHERRLNTHAINNGHHAGSDFLHLYETRVLPAWIDYNGHMTEHRYLEVFGETTDALLRLIGVDRQYVAEGYSYYTVETHIMNVDESKLGEYLTTTTQILSSDEKRIQLFHTIRVKSDNRIVATAEQMLLHVDSKASRACPALPQVLSIVEKITRQHASLPSPQTAGRHVGQRRLR